MATEIQARCTYDWRYERADADADADAGTGVDRLHRYRKAIRSQWIGHDDLPWHADVDPERPEWPAHLVPLHGSDIWRKLSARQKVALRVESSAWILSQLLHGEQGALLVSAQLVGCVPTMASKLESAAQVADEARHVEVMNRYLEKAYGARYPVDPELATLLDSIAGDCRWDMKCLGMQIMIEGLALAAVGLIRHATREPLLAAIATYIVHDEARHMNQGLLALRDLYQDMAEHQRREREDFAYEAAVLMRDRLLFRDVWDKEGLPVAECMDIALHDRGQIMFRQRVFGRVIPALDKLGLLSARMRARLRALGIL